MWTTFFLSFYPLSHRRSISFSSFSIFHLLSFFPPPFTSFISFRRFPLFLHPSFYFKYFCPPFSSLISLLRLYMILFHTFVVSSILQILPSFSPLFRPPISSVIPSSFISIHHFFFHHIILSFHRLSPNWFSSSSFIPHLIPILHPHFPTFPPRFTILIS